ncbi:hypothetical protein C8R21_102175 [Nitrosospira multiformis]|uniref:Uncharacterized protein n=2 Tax=Nitrosospira multiformis TaxID=1231 RepID=A0A2T5IH86_9PROT|nr:hypothetical protein C8R21_102175 [Nitrosospira multiformis]
MGLRLIITALEGSLFLKAHNDMAALVLRITDISTARTFEISGFNCTSCSGFILNPATRHSMRLNVKKHKMVREMDFLRVPVTQERLKLSEGKLIGFDG